LMPPMPQLPVATPGAPVLTAVRADRDGTTVLWRTGQGPAATAYAVYRLDPGSDTGRLVGTVRHANRIVQSIVDRDPTATPGSRYCVSGLDRSWNEGRLSVAMSLT